MRDESMGRTVTEAMIENLQDLFDADRSLLPADQVRRITITDALVDTGSYYLCLPSRYIQQLGLTKRGTKRVTTTNGERDADVYGTVRLTIMGRDCPADVLEVSDRVPVLVGQIPLELLDFVVDLKQQRLVGNPAHGGEHVIEMY